MYFLTWPLHSHLKLHSGSVHLLHTVCGEYTEMPLSPFLSLDVMLTNALAGLVFPIITVIGSSNLKKNLNHSTSSCVLLPAASMLHKELQRIPRGNKNTLQKKKKKIGQESQSNQTAAGKWVENPESLLCKYRSDSATRSCTWPTYSSSSTIPSPTERRSEEARSKGTGLINHHHTGIKPYWLERGGGKQSRVEED